MSRSPAPKGRTLVVQVSEDLRSEIAKGTFRPGDRLPSEARLTQQYGVSRTVVREAIAALRSDGLVAVRQGAGVFVLPPAPSEALPFRNLDLARVSSVIELLELRTAVEGDAAALAALRRSPVQEEQIIEAFDALRRLSQDGQPTADADLAFHLSIAEASNNPRFAEFLRLLGPGVIPRRDQPDAVETAAYTRVLDAEHEAVLIAIQDRDEEGARRAMRAHLKNSQARYRALLRQT